MFFIVWQTWRAKFKSVSARIGDNLVELTTLLDVTPTPTQPFNVHDVAPNVLGLIWRMYSGSHHHNLQPPFLHTSEPTASSILSQDAELFAEESFWELIDEAVGQHYFQPQQLNPPQRTYNKCTHNTGL